MAERDAGVTDLAILVELINAARTPLQQAEAMLRNLHGLLTDGEVLEQVDDATAVATAFADSLTAGAGALATFLDRAQTAASDTSGPAGLPASSASVNSAASGYGTACAAAALSVTEQGEALRDKGLAHVREQVEEAAESCSKAGRLPLAKMDSLHEAATDGLRGLIETHGALARGAVWSATEVTQQAGELPADTQATAAAIAKACTATAAAFGDQRSALQAVFDQRRTEMEAEAQRLEDAAAGLLSARAAEAGSAEQSLSQPLDAPLVNTLPACTQELREWQASLEPVLEAAAGLEELAAQLTRAREVMELSNATLQGMGQE
jgi:flagellar motility protein MotE (MotC chaperone)